MDVCIKCIWEEFKIPLKKYIKKRVSNEQDVEDILQAILQTEFQNMTQKELSDKLGISISGTKSRVQRARKMLKEMLLGCCELEMDRRGNIIGYKHKSSQCKYC
ncbi:RNA polymerase sigma factor SigZ [Clostridium homopropionicum DSM 5847]|uniref:RNA polymerase sigma factor SigZ n=1 Tax=Clostridium homopropionicum DSM 5847 TaxID=1121318 RepID=A0A0L6Z9Y9_9CLOT|nr:sigma factor-like helix-turn-helix DNA-binding protein [Clostridium homopropionicum]KOA19784.1 RNA polymerase sigma factor SigZ [Clostridium homopropionicum DSM 5847]SFF77548.1 RNA polymerase sigma-70 factor, ECF subfamily [Clostridium homopropionicum]